MFVGPVNQPAVQARRRRREDEQREHGLAGRGHHGLAAAVCLVSLACWPPLPALGNEVAATFDFDAALTRITQAIDREDLKEDEVRQLIELAERIKERAKEDLTITARLERAVLNPLVMFGLIAQGTFMMRFVLQIIASERKGRSYVPVAFWYLSMVGGLLLFVYAAARRDPVFMLGQGLGIAIYARNLYLIGKRGRELRTQRDGRTEPADDEAATTDG